MSQAHMHYIQHPHDMHDSRLLDEIDLVALPRPNPKARKDFQAWARIHNYRSNLDNADCSCTGLDDTVAAGTVATISC